EQAEWGYGKEYFAKGDLDAVFAFPLYMAVGRFNKQDLMNKIDSTFLSTPAGKHQLVFIENHDTDRFASVVAENPGKLRVGAALNILLKGIPSIYYGQELGMKGVKQEWGPTDANDILRREAFEWYQTVDGPGMALWYRDSGPWWDLTNLRDDDGISLEEQQATPGSLWQFYRQLLTLRREHAAL
ncbi:MAG: alpha-amylase, partial [Calditrichaeota bacterium]|nr:alpha-amylase [Calditrichota bacterium]